MTGPIYQFGSFRLNADSLELLKDGEPVRVERKPLELLLLLVRSEGRLVTRSQIARQLWGDEVFVDTEHGINTAVRKVRAALSDDPEAPCYVRTVPRMGYCFLVPVTLAVADPSTIEELVTALPGAPSPASAEVKNGWALPAALTSALLLLFVAVIASLSIRRGDSPPRIPSEQLTDLNDSASAPALSPDGHTVAFLRGPEIFSTGPIYAKTLPHGEARLVTDDDRSKYGLAFSPDGTEVAFSAFDSQGLDTFIVPAAGGPVRLFMENAAGLTWLDRNHLLFSQVRSGVHLGVVEKDMSTGLVQDLYFPSALRGMAHYSFPSPDRRSLLVVEMDGTGAWAPCRLVVLAGEHPTQPVGPNGPCQAAAWSPDGRWMYFVANVDGQDHIWRQRSPSDSPQQITFGATEEAGLATESSGALITSIGNNNDALYYHDSHGDRPLSSEGSVQTGPALPLFRQNDSILYYLIWRNAEDKGAELWRCSPQTGAASAVFPGLRMLDFDISSDGREVVFTTPSVNRTAELWLAPVDHTYPPVKLGIQGAQIPRFGASGQIVYQIAEGNANYLEQVQRNGSGRRRLTTLPITQLQGISPDGRWVTALVTASPANRYPTVFAFPLDGSSPRRLCNGYCVPRWSSDGRFLVLSLSVAHDQSPGSSLAIPVGPGKTLPDLPPAGLDTSGNPKAIPGSFLLERPDMIPGAGLGHYAYVQSGSHRNLFRLTVQ